MRSTPLTAHVARGVGWNYAGSATILTAQLAYTAMTARLLEPREFGAYAAAQAFVGLVGYLTLTTLGSGVIRHAEPSRNLIGTALFLSVVAAASGALLLALAAPFWAEAWSAPRAEPLIRLFALAAFFSALSAVPLALLRRRLRFKVSAATEATAQVVGMGCGIAAVLVMETVAGLVLGQVVAAAIVMAASTVLARREIAFAFSRSAARDLLSFATQSSGQNFGYFVLYTLPAWLISRTAGQAALGFYSRAHLIVWLPLTHLAAGLTKALYPMYGRSGPDPRDVGRFVEPTLLGATLALWPLLGALAGAAPIVSLVLLGPGWSQSAQLLPPLAIFGALNLAFVVAGNPLEARAHFGRAWRIQLGWFALLAVGLLLARAFRFSAVEIVLVAAAAQAAAHAGQLRVVARMGYVNLRIVGTGYVVAIAGAVGFFGVTRSLVLLTSELPTSAAAVLVFASAAAGVLLVVAAIRWSRAAQPLRLLVAQATGLPSREAA